MAAEVLIYLLKVFVFNYKLCLLVKKKACLKIAMPAHCFNIFGVLFCLLIKKLILENNAIWESMRKFQCDVWRVRTFPDMEKGETFFSFWQLHIGTVWSF